MKNRLCLVAAACLMAVSGSQAVSLPAAGYTQSFDSMLANGTVPPIDWRVFNGPSGTSNSTWTTVIADAGVAAMVANTSPLTVATAPAANANNGFNAAVSVATVSDRILATAPTTISGAALELSLTNNTGFAFSALNVAYDTVRFTAPGTANELPGYQLFFSLGTTNVWTNVASFNPTLTTVPNSVGVSQFAGVVSLGGSVPVGGTVLLRWVDDNAVQSSPDQIIGLNNVSISAVPEPGAITLMLAGLVLMGWLAHSRANRRD